MRKLAAADPGNAGWQRDVSVSLDKVGDVRLAAGDRAGALAAYEESLAIRRKLAAADPGNAGWQRDVSVSLSKVGDVRLAAGDRAGALAAYEEGLAIMRKLAAADPGNAGWQRDLSVSLEKVGDVRLAAGDRRGRWRPTRKVWRSCASSPPPIQAMRGWQVDLVVRACYKVSTACRSRRGRARDCCAEALAHCIARRSRARASSPPRSRAGRSSPRRARQAAAGAGRGTVTRMTLYDAFVSYSHAKDKPIAAALQSVVQKLGKPWYRRRALRVFRDDTSLSATPSLWPTIEQALGQSRFLILLASPEAAASPWVNKEVAYWLEHKGADTLLIAVTDGDACLGQFRRRLRLARAHAAAAGADRPLRERAEVGGPHRLSRRRR